MLRPTTRRTALLPAVLLLSALAACADGGGSPTGPASPSLRRDETLPPPAPVDTVKSKPGNLENPVI